MRVCAVELPEDPSSTRPCFCPTQSTGEFDYHDVVFVVVVTELKPSEATPNSYSPAKRCG